MQSRSGWFFNTNFVLASLSAFVKTTINVFFPPNPVCGDFLLLDGTNFLLLDGQNFELLCTGGSPFFLLDGTNFLLLDGTSFLLL